MTLDRTKPTKLFLFMFFCFVYFFLVNDRETKVSGYLLKLKKTRPHEPVLGGPTQDYRQSVRSDIIVISCTFVY